MRQTTYTRLSFPAGWPAVRLCRDETLSELVVALQEYFRVYGVPEQLTTDGAQVFVSSTMRRFLETWGVDHRVATAYNSMPT